jgi:hypothetical protein
MSNPVNSGTKVNAAPAGTRDGGVSKLSKSYILKSYPKTASTASPLQKHEVPSGLKGEQPLERKTLTAPEMRSGPPDKVRAHLAIKPTPLAKPQIPIRPLNIVGKNENPTALTLPRLARALGGVIANGEVHAPGPGHRRVDRSLSVKIDARAPDGLLIFSFAGEGLPRCRDYVRTRLGLDSKSPPSNAIVRDYFYPLADGSSYLRVQRTADSVFSSRTGRSRAG